MPNKSTLDTQTMELQELSSKEKTTPCALHSKLLAEVISELQSVSNDLKSEVRDIIDLRKDVDRLVEEVIMGNGKMPLLVRVDRLEQAKLTGDEIKKELRSAAIKTLVPIVIAILALGVVFIGGANKYMAHSNIEEIKQALQETIDEKGTISTANDLDGMFDNASKHQDSKRN